MTPVRIKVDPQPDGTRTVSVACRCARVGRHAATWEDVDDVIEELRARHRREAPGCQHPWLPMSRR